MGKFNTETFEETLPTRQRLFFRHWPAERPRAVLCIVHGLGEHSGRYQSYAEFLTMKNISCLAVDLPGHGRSSGKRGHFKSLQEVFDCVDALLAKGRALYRGQPVFLLGQSMGGNIVLNYALQNPHGISGIVAQSSWIRLPNPPSNILLRFAKFMKGIYPAFDQSNGLNPLDLATSPAVAKAYQTDPLVHDRISVAAGLTMLDAAARLELLSGKYPVPLLLMHGTADRITDPQGSAALAKRLSGDVQLLLWDGYYHELHNEPIGHEVMQKVADWVSEHCM